MVLGNEISPEMFWGIKLEPGKKYTQTVEASFHISMAALELSNASGEPTSVMISHNDAEFVLCSLSKTLALQQSLDLNFVEGESLTLYVNGKGSVHLTGYRVFDDTEGETSMNQLMGDEEMSEDLSEEDSDELEDEIIGKKRKLDTMAAGDSINKKTKLATAAALDEVDDSDDADDEDFLDQEVEVSGEEDSDDEEDSDEDDDEEEEDEEGEEDSDEEGDSDDDESIDEEQIKEMMAELEREKAKTAQAKKDSKQPNGQKKLQTPKEEKNEQKTPKSEPKKQQEKTPTMKQEKQAPKSEPKPAKNQTPKTEKNDKNQTPKQDKKKDKKQQQKTPNSATPQKRKLPSGITLTDMKSGHGPDAKQGRMVHVYYKGTLENGKVFDSKLSGNPFKFRLGKNEVIKGWELGVQGMKVGGKRTLSIPPNLAYGNQKIPGIPANSTLNFEIELKNIS